MREHKYRVILGKSFLVENRMAVNAPRKRISVISEDGTREDLYLSGPFCCQRVVSRAPCRSVKTLRIVDDEPVKILVQVGLAFGFVCSRSTITESQ